MKLRIRNKFTNKDGRNVLVSVIFFRVPLLVYFILPTLGLVSFITSCAATFLLFFFYSFSKGGGGSKKKKTIYFYFFFRSFVQKKIYIF